MAQIELEAVHVARRCKQAPALFLPHFFFFFSLCSILPARLQKGNVLATRRSTRFDHSVDS